MSTRFDYRARRDGSVDISLTELTGADSIPFEIEVTATDATIEGSLQSEGDDAVVTGLEAGDKITITYEEQTYSRFTYPEF